MKIQQQERKFKPVTITLESQEEVDMLLTLTGSLIGEGKMRDFTDSVFNGLRTFGDYRRTDHLLVDIKIRL